MKFCCFGGAVSGFRDGKADVGTSNELVLRGRHPKVQYSIVPVVSQQQNGCRGSRAWVKVQERRTIRSNPGARDGGSLG